jgi:beta-galactosidase
LRELALDIDIVGPEASLAGYALVIVPSMPYVPDALVAALEAFDGTLLVMPRAGSRTRSHRIPDNLAPGPLAVRLGIRVTRVESFRPGSSVPLTLDNEVFHFDRWREFVTPTEAEVVARTEDGQAALTRRSGAHYLAGSPDKALTARLVGRLAREAGLDFTPLPQGLRLRRRGDMIFAFNYGPLPVELAPVVCGERVLGEPVLAVGGVAVMRP